MQIIVQKFGGTSLATEEARLAAVKHVEDAVAKGFRVVVVVSAMGRQGDPYATDTLLGILGDTTRFARRDLDILMSCGEAISAVTFAGLLRRHGHDCIVLSGQQAGIVTDFEHGDARILDIRPLRILSALKNGQIVIVMGFQGATADGDLTTLGRGGSDTSAAALGGALGAKYVDIFTDVDGIMTADPRIVPEAGCLRHASYDEICQLAHHGAKVIHPSAVQTAMSGDVPVRVRNTFNRDGGTLITKGANPLQVTGVTSTAEAWHVQFHDVSTAKTALAEAHGFLGNSVHFDEHTATVVVAPSSHNKSELSAVLHAWSQKARAVQHCSKVSVIAASEWTESDKGVLSAKEALGRAGISVVSAGTSNRAIWCLVQPEWMVAAVNVLHRELGLVDLVASAATV